MSKARAQRIHAKRRALERYGVALNRHELRALVADIQHGRARFVERQSLRVSLFEVMIGDRPVRVVYDRERKTIVTFLPPAPDVG